MVTRRRGLRVAACLLIGYVAGCEAFLDTDEPDRKRENGVECTGAPQCLSGHCVDSVCCESACDGACEGCSALAKQEGDDGVCGPVPGWVEPGCPN